jgi:hypothetical protein
MDHVTALDMLLINAGQLPDHINHTGLGMYLLMRITSVTAAKLGFLSTTSLDDLAIALNPLLPLAEFTTFLRLHSPFIITASALAGYTSIILVTRMPAASLGGVTILTLLISQQWTFYHATLIRTEIYAILFWQLGILAIAAAARLKLLFQQLSIVPIGGALVGLALITKFQTFPYVVAFYVLVKMIADLRQVEFSHLGESYTRYYKYFILVNMVSLMTFGALWIGAWQYQLQPNYFIVSDAGAGKPVTYGPSLIAALFFVVGFSLLFVQLTYRRSPLLRRLFSSHDLALFSLVQIGYASAAFFGMLVFCDPSVGWSYTVANYKVAYLRQFMGMGLGSILDLLWSNVNELVGHYYVLLLLTGSALLCILILLVIAPDVRERATCLRIALGASVIVAVYFIGSVFFRFFVRDIIWHETLLTFIVALLFAIAGGVISRSYSEHRGLQFASVVAVAPLLVLILTNLLAFRTIAMKTDLNYNIYGWSPRHVFFDVYGGNQLLYRSVVAHRFPELRMEPASVAGIAFGHAVEWHKVLRTAQFVIPYQHVPLTKIGVFALGNSYTTDGERLLSVPKGFDGAILVDLQGLVSRPVGIIDAESVSQDSEAFDKITSQPAIGKMAIIPRTDLDITLFSEDDAQSGSCELSVTAAKAGKTAMKFCGKMIRAYTEIDLYRNRRNFLVVRPKFGAFQ